MRTLFRPLIVTSIVLAATATWGQAPGPAGGAGSQAWAGLYSEYCAVCHGADLTGAAQGPALVGVDLKHGDSVEALVATITKGVPGTHMEAFSSELSDTQIRTLAIYIGEERARMPFADFRIAPPLEVPTGPQSSELHDFRFEVVADGLDPLPYSIAPLPDGSILLTEKMRGLTVISDDGEQSDLIAGAPTGYDDAPEGGVLRFGNGWILDVAPHPDFEENGWIYLSFGDRCSGCNEISRSAGKPPVSGLKLIRGRIRDGRWVDEETLWQIDRKLYVPGTDMAAGGRIAFDGAGHLFLSFGMMPGVGYAGIQDLDRPWGKIHRILDDGRVPEDNPFVGDSDAVPTIWSYGHRSPHGLEYDRQTGQLWETEMGPRGGDEVNLVVAGRNYGWPLTSKGVHYNGKPVDGEGLGIEVHLDEIEQPVVDLTPGVAVSSFVIYHGDAFPKWRGNLLVGSLRGSDLYRFEVADGKLVHRETVVHSLARIRDVEVEPDGAILLLLEHGAGGQIVRMSPAADISRTPSGRPDLSGSYDVSTLTPLERRPELGERRAYTAQEAAEIQGRAAQREITQYLPSDPERDAPPAGGNVGGYNAYYIDRGSGPVLTRGEYRTSLIIDPPDGRFPPLTERGRKRRERLHPYGKPNPGTAWWLDSDDPRYAEHGPYDGPETLAIADRCIFHPEASIPVEPRSYNNLKTIVQTETHVVILIEWMHEARIVRLAGEGRPVEHAPPEVRSLSGDSIGWWEGDTLVVDTTNFLEQDWISETLVGNPPFPSDLHVVERFTRIDPENLLYEFTVESGDFETPYSGEYTWPQTSDRLYEYACHEGNYAMGNILRGARLLESEAEQAR